MVDERERPGITSNSPKKGRYCKTSSVEQKKVLASLRKDMKKDQRQLSALKSKRAGSGDNKSADTVDEKTDDAGKNFQVDLRRRRPSPSSLDSLTVCVCI